MIHHYNADPNITFPISIGVIVTIMVLYGIYKGSSITRDLRIHLMTTTIKNYD